MRLRSRIIPALGALLTASAVFAQDSVLTPGRPPTRSEMVLIPAGVFSPPFRNSAQTTQALVTAFLLDVLPVTNEDFLRFVRANPEWRRARVEPRFADASYLSQWSGDLDLGDAQSNAPVTHVSWFAARAYARWQDKRLPQLKEWELAAAASTTQPDASREPEFQQRILRWYSAPTPTRLPAVGTSPANFFGLRDLHGLVWEWVADFDAPLAGDSTTGSERDKFCGSGALGARAPADYATYMRYGFRSSLQANYCVASLGFRCARSVRPNSP